MEVEDMELDNDIRQLDEVRTLVRPRAAGKVIVIAEGWPSISFVLKTQGYSITTYLMSKNLFAFLEQNFPHIRPILVSQFEEIVQPLNESFFIWCQGENLLDEWERWVESKMFQAAEYIVGITPSKGRKCKPLMKHLGFKCVNTTHVAHGGITLGRWIILLSRTPHQAVEYVIKGSTLRRKLRHILDFTIKGICYGATSKTLLGKRLRDQVPAYNLDDCVVPAVVKFDVVTPCVLQRYDLVKRPISKTELWHIYDLQSSVIDTLSRHVDDAVVQEITQAAPEKVVASVVMGIHQTNVNEQVDSLAGSGNQQRVQLIEHEEEAELNDEKAARNDDAEIQTQQWDRYLMRSFNPSLQQRKLSLPLNHVKTLVCNPITHIEEQIQLFDKLRLVSLIRFRTNVYKSFIQFMKSKYGNDFMNVAVLYNQHSGAGEGKVRRILGRQRKWGKEVVEDFIRDFSIGREAVERALHSSFWDWDSGSSLFYWRWPKVCRKEARDGVEIFITGKLPRYRESQRWPREEDQREAMIKKWLKVVDRGYVKAGQVASLTGSFAVPKGSGDIRMVYDASKCGLNEVLWAPNFLLPTIDMVVRQANEGSWFGDIDLGEQFLNFNLDESLKPYAGIDVTAIKDRLPEGTLKESQMKSEGRVFLRWERTLMGLRSSPYNAQKMMAWICNIIRGNPLNPNNVFRWDKYIANCPGHLDYNPAQPVGCKWSTPDNGMAASFEIYVDDVRTSGSSEEACVNASRRVSSLCNHYGIQDAARKRRFPSMKPSVWCGSRVITDGQGIFTTTTQEKWDKGKEIIFCTMKELESSVDGQVDRNALERGRGFLIHLARTYPGMVPFLKGLHHTLETWRGGRDKDGWKFGREDWLNLLTDEDKDRGLDWKDMEVLNVKKEASPPKRVQPVERLKRDLEALTGMTASPKPSNRLLRSLGFHTVIYAFGDASGCGFGSSWTVRGKTRYRIGLWGSDNKDKSSNYRELKNLLETLQKLDEEGDLNGSEIYLFTDNSTSENTYYKGSSKSKLLHGMVGQLRALELSAGCRIDIIHVAGERMKAQGADGLSRGNMLEGVMQHRSILDFVPLHLGALERNGGAELLHWLRSWIPDRDDLVLLKPEDWFLRAHDIVGFTQGQSLVEEPVYQGGTYLWTPPPALAEVACEELRKARNKRQVATHLFVCPRLMTPWWKKHIHRSADLIFEVPPGESYWPLDNYEPLTIALFFPFLSCSPWQLKRSKVFVEMEGLLSRVWKECGGSSGSILCKFWKQTNKLYDLPSCMVQPMLHSLTKFGVSYQ